MKIKLSSTVNHGLPGPPGNKTELSVRQKEPSAIRKPVHRQGKVEFQTVTRGKAKTMARKEDGKSGRESENESKSEEKDRLARI